MQTFLDAYEQYMAPGLEQEVTRQANILPLIKTLPRLFRVEETGQSFEGRPIYGIWAGNGPVRTLAWSQMHGNESTATRSLMDICQFLADDNAAFSETRNTLLSHISLLLIPMINPDGAQRWQRENAQDIDINRDARRGTTPEGRLLHKLCHTFAPHFALNLHDQNSYYSAGVSRHPATFSFLAAPADNSGHISANMETAMKLIVHVHDKLQKFLPQQTGRWNDDYEPRAFGEWFQSQQVATLLIESGGHVNDPQRNKVRYYHFGILLETLLSIATGSYHTASASHYYRLPLNRENGLFDHIARNIKITLNGTSFITDVGYRKEEKITGDLNDYGSLSEEETEEETETDKQSNVQPS